MESGTGQSRRDVVPLLLLWFALAHVALGAWQLISPGSFFDALGPFGHSNAHYTRDVGTFTLALGVAFWVAYVRPAWRLGVVGYALFQYAFHAVNHLADIGKAHPVAVGPVDFALIAGTALILGWMLRLVARGGAAVPP